MLNIASAPRFFTVFRLVRVSANGNGSPDLNPAISPLPTVMVDSAWEGHHIDRTSDRPRSPAVFTVADELRPSAVSEVVIIRIVPDHFCGFNHDK